MAMTNDEQGVWDLVRKFSGQPGQRMTKPHYSNRLQRGVGCPDGIWTFTKWKGAETVPQITFEYSSAHPDYSYKTFSVVALNGILEIEPSEWSDRLDEVERLLRAGIGVVTTEELDLRETLEFKQPEL